MNDGLITLHNVRGGLATNSSSSHSLIFLPHPVSDDLVGVNDDGEWWFSHEDFVLASSDAKRIYLAFILRYALGRTMPDDLRRLIIRDWIGLSDVPEGGIDHQSVFGLPCAFGSDYPSRPFFDELVAFVLRPTLAILGGSDNYEDQMYENQPLASLGTPFHISIPETGDGPVIARKDPRYGFWTVFNQVTGGKVRFSFQRDPATWRQRPYRATAPELVDLKITGYCPFAGNGCNVPCYQGSDRTGVHAPYDRLKAILDALGRLEVFEVAIGGGEPTLHPQFVGLLAYARARGIVPNFTTRNLAWLRDPRQWVPILEHAGAFAFSAHDPNEIDDLAALLRMNGIRAERATIHIVMGTQSRYSLGALLETAARNGLRVTLLGYKAVGRGSGQEPISYDWWLDVIRECADRNRLPQVSVDTPLAAQYESEILAAGIPSWLFHTREGAFSAYIDAVAWQVGPSSFDGPEAMRNLPQIEGGYGPESDDARRIAETLVSGMDAWTVLPPSPDLPDLSD